MPRSGTGTYSLPAPPSPFQNGQTASATDMMTVLNDVATALTASTAADGQTPITGNWDFNGKNITDVGTLTATGIVAVDGSTTNGLTVGNVLVVTKGGATITGNSTINGTISVSNGTSGTLAVNYSQFPTSAAGTGGFVLPTGLIVKWGVGTTTLGVGNVTFADAFPTGIYHVSLTLRNFAGTATVNPIGTATVNTTGFDVRGDAGQSLAFYWLAIGS